MSTESSSNISQMNAFARLPKTDMHLHVEGSISLSEYRQVVDVPEGWKPRGWAPEYRYETFAEFEEFILGYADHWFNSPDRYHISAKSLFERKKAENVRYLECSFAAIVMQMQQLPIDEVVDAIKSAVPDGIEVRLFMGLHHDGWLPETEGSLTRALDLDGLDGIDLHGPERYPVRDWMLDYWPAARAAGKVTKAHAGELGGAWHVREAVEKLGVTRVEHGFHAVEDPAVMQLLKDQGTILSICPVSNYKLKTVESYRTHPIRQLVDAGIVCTVNTDDPFIFGNTIQDEFAALLEHEVFDLEELIQLARNGFENALIDEATRATYLSEFNQIASEITK